MMFRASLVNPPGGDPGVYVEMKYRRRALLFDLGEIYVLPPRNILKVEHICISHTHMDHFIGFDRLVRLCLGRNREVALYGPPGFLGQIERRLGAYNWNLVEGYVNDFDIVATEASPEGRQRTRRFSCRHGFRPREEGEERPFSGLLWTDRHFTLRGAFLDHRTPCLAFRLEERRRINIRKDALAELGLPTGPWLNELKDCLLDDRPPDFPVRIRWKETGEARRERQAPLGELVEKIVRITPGQKIAYVTDAVYSAANVRTILSLAEGVDILFIEAPFLHADADQAARKYHLTARQAGILAGKAGAKRMIPFHFSPKYRDREEELHEEATTAFRESAEGRERSG
ncbi:MAG: MBL fold metallo-hydrolase [Pseudomonadota bacterium]|nr:MBL fold metallo-hydrolase [Pseudomonadota bacterium]